MPLIQSPFRYICAGPSQSGKTTHVINLIKFQDQILSKPHKNIIYCTKEKQVRIEELKKQGYIKKILFEIPNEKEIKDMVMDYGRILLVLDDFGGRLDKSVSEICTVLSHHLGLDCIILLQSVFHKNPIYKDISNNANYFSLFSNPRDKTVISHFARQMSPGDSVWIKQIFLDLSRSAYAYLHFDFSQNCPEELRISSHILPHEWPRRYYVKDK